MNNKQQTVQKIEELEVQLEVLKKELEQKPLTIQDAAIGDALEDGSIVVDKQGSMALIAAPESTEVRCQWSKEFKLVFDKLKQEGLNPSQWFIPNKEQLKVAHTNCREHLAGACYWSSTEVSSTGACYLGFSGGSVGAGSKAGVCCVRAFRVVYF